MRPYFVTINPSIWVDSSDDYLVEIVTLSTDLAAG